MIRQKLLSYLKPGQKQGAGDNVNLKMMHGINKISLFMFLIAVIVILIKNIF